MEENGGFRLLLEVNVLGHSSVEVSLTLEVCDTQGMPYSTGILIHLALVRILGRKRDFL